MDNRGSNSPSDVIRRGISSLNMVIIWTTFVFMLVMIILISDLDPTDMFTLNLVHSIDVFLEARDWKNSGLNLFFGILYLTATFWLSIHVAVPCVACIVVSWIASCHRLGYPHVSWIFFVCMVMWIMKTLYRYDPEPIVIIAVAKTTSYYGSSEEKSAADILMIVNFIALNSGVLFAVRKIPYVQLFACYLLSLAWMGMKST